jgi:hypothetical protein
VTAVAECRDPGAAADLAAEAVRVLNHLTLAPPSLGTPGWEDVTDLYRVLAEMRVLTERLPQAIGQLARHLERPVGDGYRCDPVATEPLDVLVADAVESLAAARAAMTDCGRGLGIAQSVVSHLAPLGGTQGDEASLDDGWRESDPTATVSETEPNRDRGGDRERTG